MKTTITITTVTDIYGMKTVTETVVRGNTSTVTITDIYGMKTVTETVVREVADAVSADRGTVPLYDRLLAARGVDNMASHHRADLEDLEKLIGEHDALRAFIAKGGAK